MYARPESPAAPVRAADPERAMGAQHPAGIQIADPSSGPRLVVHIVDVLDGAHGAGGLLDLIRHLPPQRYRHVIVCLDGCKAIQRGEFSPQAPGVEIIRLPRPGPHGPPPSVHALQLYRLLRALRPDVVHTRNRGGLWTQALAALAGVGVRVHAEARHVRRRERAQTWAGWRRRMLRRMLCPLVDHFIAASGADERWLVDKVGAAPARVSHIANGVDSVQFHPRLGPAAALGPPGFMRDGVFVVGSAGRMDDAGNHVTLVEAFLRLIASPHPAHQRLRLLIVGDGPARAECQALLQRAGAAERAWLAGARPDLPQLLRAMDVFVLPGLREDRSSAVLEAMATGLPVIAAAGAAHSELVHPGFTGLLVPGLSVEMLASALADYCRIPDMAVRHGARARSQVIARHSMPAMARDVLAIYDALSCAGDDAWRPA
jgi:sugar transferase (PEP-CTERM/EpsH1 system associated)